MFSVLLSERPATEVKLGSRVDKQKVACEPDNTYDQRRLAWVKSTDSFKVEGDVMCMV